MCSIYFEDVIIFPYTLELWKYKYKNNKNILFWRFTPGYAEDILLAVLKGLSEWLRRPYVLLGIKSGLIYWQYYLFSPSGNFQYLSYLNRNSIANENEVLNYFHLFSDLTHTCIKQKNKLILGERIHDFIYP